MAYVTNMHMGSISSVNDGMAEAEVVKENREESDVIWLHEAKSKYKDGVPEMIERAFEGVPEVDRSCLTTASRSWSEKR